MDHILSDVESHDIYNFKFIHFYSVIKNIHFICTVCIQCMGIFLNYCRITHQIGVLSEISIEESIFNFIF